MGSVFLCSKHAISLLVRSGGGLIINTGSSASLMGIPGCDACTATKGATLALTRSMAVECGRQGIRVSCICPSGIEAEMVKASNLDDPSSTPNTFSVAPRWDGWADRKKLPSSRCSWHPTNRRISTGQSSAAMAESR